MIADFLDTNILIYAFDTQAPVKRARSSGERTATLPIVAALDGRDAARGHFEGRAAVRLEWSFR